MTDAKKRTPPQMVGGSSRDHSPRSTTSKTPDWSFWKQMAMVDLWQAVALSLDINPEAIEKAARGTFDDYGLRRYDGCGKAFRDRITFAVNWVQSGDLVPAERKRAVIYSTVRLAEFADWARDTMGWSLPNEMMPAREDPAAAVARVVAAEPTLWCNSDDVKLSQTDRRIWCGEPGWTPEEMTALALHRKPDAINTLTMSEMRGSALLAGEFDRLLARIKRAVTLGELREIETPSNCLQWLLDHQELEDLTLWPRFTAGKGAQLAHPTEPTMREPAEVVSPEPAVKRTRTPDAKAVARNKEKYRTVVAAGQEMHDRNHTRTINWIAKQLLKTQKDQGLRERALRQILSGSYPAAIKLGISGIDAKKST